MGIPARRTFSLDDQRAFAALSGDWNPLHVDPVAARRTLFGAALVHGMHLVMWALDEWSRVSPAPARIVEIRAAFRKPVHLDREIVLKPGESSDGGLELRATSAEGCVLELAVRAVPCRDPARECEGAIAERTWSTSPPPDDLDPEAAATCRGELELAIDSGAAGRAFPAACSRFGLGLVAELLAATRLVGMHCPGLHSVFGGLHLREGGRSRAGFGFEVASAVPKYSIVNLRVEGPQLSGQLETFFRPRPAAISMSAVAETVRPGEFAHQRALVVGGSRGLGEALAKAIACGGGQVCLTYHRGAADAERVVREIAESGGKATAFAFDATEPRPLAESWPLAGPPTHLYFLATPKIPVRQAGFVVADLDLLLRTYVAGLHAAVVAALELGPPSLVVWSPSTTMLDGKGGAEYCIAKAAMEELCRQLPSLYPVTVFAPRLPKIETDQTASLIRVSAASAIEIAVAELRRWPAPPP